MNSEGLEWGIIVSEVVVRERVIGKRDREGWVLLFKSFTSLYLFVCFSVVILP